MKGIKRFSIMLFVLIFACACFVACTPSDSNQGEPETKEFTVTFDPDGGTLSGNTSVKVEENKSITLPTVTKENYAFVGWFNGETNVGLIGASFTPSANVTLKAHWSEDLPDYAAINFERSVEYAKKIKSLYWNSDTKLSLLTPEGGKPYLWPFTEQVSMANGILQVMDKNHADRKFFEDYLAELIEGLRHYRVSEVNVGTGQSWNNANHELAAFGVTDSTGNKYAIYSSGRNDGAIDSKSEGFGSIFFDDNIWVVKEYYYAYLNLGEEKYLNEALNIVNWIIGEGYESTKGLNGIYWNWGAKFMFSETMDDEVHASLNACSSAPTAMMLAKLYNVLSDNDHKSTYGTLAETYLSRAQSIYEFCYSVLRDTSNNCLRDKVYLREGFKDLPESQRIQLTDGQVLGYNTGIFMTAGAELYKINAAANKTAVANLYKKRNTEVAAGADRNFANTQIVKGQYSYDSNSWFTSFLLEGFIDIAETGVDCKVYIEHMRSSLDYGYNNFRNADDGLVSPAWVAGWSVFNNSDPGSQENPRQILLQSANAHCYAMLVRYYKK